MGTTYGTPQKPVGTIWLAVANQEQVISQKFNLGNHRERNIIRASLFALNMLRETLIKSN